MDQTASKRDAYSVLSIGPPKQDVKRLRGVCWGVGGEGVEGDRKQRQQKKKLKDSQGIH